jgi:drug/metabolite transporter (DMT)-like permease
VRGAGPEAGAFAALTLVWGTTWAAIRVALGGVPPLTGIAARFLIAGLLLLGLARWRGIRLGVTAIERRLWLLNTFATFVVPYGIIYWAEQWVPSGLASVLFATFPLWVVLVGRWVLPGERPGAGRLLGVVLGFAGVALIFSEDFDRLGGAAVRLPAAVLLVGAAISASASVAIRRWGAGISPVSLAAVPMTLTGFLVGGLAALTERHRPLDLSAAPVAATLYLAIFGSAFTFSVYFWLLSRRSAVVASLVAYTAPVVAVAVGLAFLDEPFTARVAIGAALVLAGVAGALSAPLGRVAAPVD